MNDIGFLQGKKIAVLGLGIEGIALVDFLVDVGAKISILDKFSESELLKNGVDSEKIKSFIENKKIEKIFGEHYLDNLERFDIIFRSPGLSYLNPQIQEAKSKGATISSQIKLFFDLCPCQIVGVTGTKGKGTTSSLISEILKRKLETRNSKLETNSKHTSDFGFRISDLKPQVYLAGNIGYPAITLLPELKKNDIVILELSSFQLMDIDKSPHISVITNLTVDHLDYHKSIEEYRKSKINILKYQTESDFAVLNFDSTLNKEELKNIKSSIKYFSGEHDGGDGAKNFDAYIEDKNDEATVILKTNDEKVKICEKKKIKLFGRHNLENIAAASVTANILGIDIETIKEVAKNFKGLSHRLEFVREIKGIKFINDSYATNPDPTIAAIHSFPEKKVLILGGSSKGADFSNLAKEITEGNVVAVVLIGDEAEKIESALKKKSFSGQIIAGGKTMEEIVKTASKVIEPYELFILSPACASFGLFKNYKDRGEQFKTEVIKL